MNEGQHDPPRDDVHGRGDANESANADGGSNEHISSDELVPDVPAALPVVTSDWHGHVSDRVGPRLTKSGFKNMPSLLKAIVIIGIGLAVVRTIVDVGQGWHDGLKERRSQQAAQRAAEYERRNREAMRQDTALRREASLRRMQEHSMLVPDGAASDPAGDRTEGRAPEGLAVRPPGPDAPRLILEQQISCSVAAISPDGSLLVVNEPRNSNGGLLFVNPYDGRWQQLGKQILHISALRFLPDGETLCLAHSRGVGLLRDGRYRALPVWNHGRFSISPDGKWMAQPAGSILVHLESTRVKRIDIGKKTRQIAFTTNPNMAVATGRDELFCWNVDTAEIVAEESIENLYGLAAAHQVNVIATIERSPIYPGPTEVVLRDAESLAKLRSFDLPGSRVEGVRISSGADVLVIDWNGTGALVYNLNEEDSLPWWLYFGKYSMDALELSDDGNLLVMGIRSNGSDPPVLRVYDLSPCRGDALAGEAPPVHPVFKRVPGIDELSPQKPQNAAGTVEPLGAEMQVVPWPWGAEPAVIDFPCEQAVFSPDSSQLALLTRRPPYELLIMNLRTAEDAVCGERALGDEYGGQSFGGV